MKIFATNRNDDKTGFYRIIQPLRMLKRSGWEATTVPFSGKNDVSVLPIHDKLLVMLSKDTDFILTSAVTTEEELLRILNLRKLNNCKWIVDVSENIYENPYLENYIPIMEKSLSLADGVTTDQKIYDDVYILPSTIDLEMWNRKNTIPRKPKIGYCGTRAQMSVVEPVLKEITKQYKVEFVNAYTPSIIDAPKKLSKLNVTMVIAPSVAPIDILEYMILGIPVLTTFSDLPVLKAKTNFEWYENIEKLLKDNKKAKEIAKNGIEFVKSNYDMKKYTSNYQRWLKELKRKDY